MARAASRKYWLVKSEPDCFSIHDLKNSPRQTTGWSGVRNYQARNFMRDGMHVGDGVLFYHSSAKPPAVAGTAVVAREAYPDATAQDPADDHYDPAATADKPVWMMVDIRLEEIFKQPLPLDILRGVPALKNMVLLQKGSRLSVQPVTEGEYKAVLALAHSSGQAGAPRSKPKRPAASPRKRPASRS